MYTSRKRKKERTTIWEELEGEREKEREIYCHLVLKYLLYGCKRKESYYIILSIIIN